MSIIYNPGSTVSSLDNVGGALEGFTITCPSGGAAAQGDYVSMSEPDGDDYAIWLDIDAAGTAPTGAIYVAANRQVEVDIGSGDADTDVAAAVKAAMEADGSFNEYELSVASNVITAVAVSPKSVTDAAPHSENDGGAGSFAVSVVQQGVDAKVYPGQSVDSLNNNP